MVRVQNVALALVVALLCGGFLSGDDKKPVRGQLPPNWKKLGLSDEQKQKIYTIQSEYKGKIADLRKQLQALVKQQRTEMEAVLTPAQKAQLRQIITERAPKEATEKTAPKDKSSTKPKEGK